MKKNIIERSLVESKIYENTNEALNNLVENCFLSQLTCPPFISDHGGYAKEYCTVKMTTSRGCGHSTSLANVALKYFNEVIFLSPKLDMAHRLNKIVMSKYYKLVGEEEAKSSVVKHTSDHIEFTDGLYYFGNSTRLASMKGITAEAILIDGTFGLNEARENEIYQTFYPVMVKYPQKFFIFVQ